MSELPFQKIYELLEPTLPENWQKIVMYMEYDDDSYTMKYFVKYTAGNIVDCYDLKNTTLEQLRNVFSAIDDLVSEKREELKEKWQIATIIINNTINNTGKFRCDFTYLDEDQNIEEYYQKWKKQYLK